jgi:hypothetical protein
MKHFKFLAPVAVGVSMTAFLFSCNSGEEKKVDETSADTITTKAPDAKPANLMMVMHKVSNFAKWLPVFEAGDSLINAYGLHRFVVGRGVKDTNMVMVATRMDDTARAKAFAASPDLKAAMHKSGVTGMPTISYLDVQMEDTVANTASARLMVKHKVKDWDAWKKSFDSHKQARMDAGLIDRVLGYDIDDNHMVTIVFIVTDMEKAEAFSKSADLKKKMEEAGVVGPPTFFYFTIAKKY